MIAATIGFVICVIIAIWITLVCLGVFSWPGTGSSEKWGAIVILILVWLFIRWINPFTIAITVVGT